MRKLEVPKPWLHFALDYTLRLNRGFKHLVSAVPKNQQSLKITDSVVEISGLSFSAKLKYK